MKIRIKETLLFQKDKIMSDCFKGVSVSILDRFCDLGHEGGYLAACLLHCSKGDLLGMREAI